MRSSCSSSCKREESQPMKDEILMPCIEWAEKLAARHPEDISPSDRIALNKHIATCKACAAVHAAYHAMEISVRALPATSLPDFPYERLQRKDKPIMSPVSHLLTYFGSTRWSKLRGYIPPLGRTRDINQSLLYHMVVASLLLIVGVRIVGLNISFQPTTSKFST